MKKTILLTGLITAVAAFGIFKDRGIQFIEWQDEPAPEVIATVVIPKPNYQVTKSDLYAKMLLEDGYYAGYLMKQFRGVGTYGNTTVQECITLPGGRFLDPDSIKFYTTDPVNKVDMWSFNYGVYQDRSPLKFNWFGEGVLGVHRETGKAYLWIGSFYDIKERIQ
jgi:hypothetical protein